MFASAVAEANSNQSHGQADAAVVWTICWHNLFQVGQTFVAVG
jgi:hypothetical protein